MKWVTHLVTALCFIYIVSLFVPISYGGFILAGVASIVPDYFERVAGLRHRSVYFHNWLIPLAMIFFVVHPTLAGIPLGYGHHLAIDSLTKQGVYVGSRKKRVRGFLYSLNLGHNAIVVLLHYLALIFLIAS